LRYVNAVEMCGRESGSRAEHLTSSHSSEVVVQYVDIKYQASWLNMSNARIANHPTWKLTLCINEKVNQFFSKANWNSSYWQIISKIKGQLVQSHSLTKTEWNRCFHSKFEKLLKIASWLLSYCSLL